MTSPQLLYPNLPKNWHYHPLIIVNLRIPNQAPNYFIACLAPLRNVHCKNKNIPEHFVKKKLSDPPKILAAAAESLTIEKWQIKSNRAFINIRFGTKMTEWRWNIFQLTSVKLKDKQLTKLKNHLIIILHFYAGFFH